MRGLLEKIVLSLIVTFSFLGLAQAESHEGKLVTPSQLDEIVVTATKTPIRTKEVPASISVVTSEDFNIKARSDNFCDAIRNVPGVQTAKSYDMGAGFLLLRGERPVMRINGKEVGRLDATLLGTGAIERIEILRGPQSTMYGGKAITGTINIITKKGDKEHPYAQMNTLYGSGKELAGDVMFSGGKDKFSYFVNIYGSTKADWETPKGNIPYVEEDRQNFYARFDYDFLPEHILSLEYTYNEASSKTGGKGYQHEKMGNYYKKIWDIDPISLNAAYLTYEGKVSDWITLYATIGKGKNKLDFSFGYNGFNDKTPIEDYISRANFNTLQTDFIYGELRSTFDFFSENKLRILTGIQYKNTERESESFKKHKFAYSTSAEETYIAPYIHAEFKPIDYILFLAGLRYDHYSYDRSSSNNSTSPRFSVSLFPFVRTAYNWTTLWGTYSGAFNPPKVMMLQGPDFIGPNPDLKPEKIKGWEFGLKQRVDRWAMIEASYFDMDYDDMITRLAHPGVPGAKEPKFFNLNKASRKGWELMCEVYPLDWLILHFGYTDLEKRDKTSNKRMIGQADKILQYGVTIHNLYGFSASLWGRQHSDYKNPIYHQAVLGKDHPSEDKIIWDMKILYKWNIKNGLTCEPFLAIKNLTDETYYEDTVSYNLMEGRAYQTGISFKMEF